MYPKWRTSKKFVLCSLKSSAIILMNGELILYFEMRGFLKIHFQWCDQEECVKVESNNIFNCVQMFVSFVNSNVETKHIDLHVIPELCKPHYVMGLLVSGFKFCWHKLCSK